MQTFLFCLYILKEISSIILFSAVAASIVYAYCGDHKNLKDDKQIKLTGKLEKHNK